MASPNQRSYIRDLAVQKLKEFKEFKEMLYANGIVSVLQAKEAPARPKTYSQKRSEQVIQLLDEIKATADDWSYDGLR